MSDDGTSVYDTRKCRAKPDIYKNIFSFFPVDPPKRNVYVSNIQYTI